MTPIEKNAKHHNNMCQLLLFTIFGVILIAIL